MTALTGWPVARDGSNNGTTPKGMRQSLGGLLAGNGSSALDVRKGVLFDGAGALVSGKANMSYDVRAFRAVLMRSTANGPVLVANDATVNVVTTAAPGSNSRIDIIYAHQHLVAGDGGSDSDVVLEIGVAQGTAAASPSAPSIPSGALELARVTVTSGTTATSSLTISQTHPWTVPNGAPIPVRNNTERSALTAFDGLIVNHLGDDELQRYDGSSWVSVGGSDTGWLALPFNTGGNWGGGSNPAKYRVKNGELFLKGIAVRSSGSSTTVATLPAGARPPESVSFQVRIGTATSNFAIGTDGVMQCTSGYTTGSDLFLDGKNFLVN